MWSSAMATMTRGVRKDLAVSVLPLIVCCVFLIQMFKVKVGRDFEKKDMELAGAVEQQLMTLFDAYHDAAEELCTDPLVAEALKKESFGKSKVPSGFDICSLQSMISSSSSTVAPNK